MSDTEAGKYRNYTFFTAGHGLYHFDISQDTFDNSLYYNLLIQPGLAWSDHFFLQGTYVEKHLENHRSGNTWGESWIEAGLRDQKIIPFFRHRDAPDFILLEESMRSGTLKGLNLQSLLLAKRFNSALSAWGFWPLEKIAEKYYLVLKAYFNSKTPPWLGPNPAVEHKEFTDFWNRVRNLAIDIIESAYNKTKQKGADGVQVSEIINATAEKYINIVASETPINTVDELLSLLDAQINDLAIKDDLRIFFSLIMELYNHNLAECLDTQPNSPKTNNRLASVHLFKRNLFWGSDLPEYIEPEIDSLKEFVSLPRLEVLKNTSGTTLREIWGHNSAIDYFNALELWRANPIENQGNLLEKFHKYTKYICDKVKGSTPVDYEMKAIDKTTDIMTALASGAADAFIQFTELPTNLKIATTVATPLAALVLSDVTKKTIKNIPRQAKKLVEFLPYENPHIGTKDLTVPLKKRRTNNKGND